MRNYHYSCSEATMENIPKKPVTAPFAASAAVNFFLEKSQQDGVEITPMKLQKLLYFAHGWFLAFNNRPLINEECQAWQFGPVFNSVYHEYKNFGRHRIPPTKKMLDWKDTESNNFDLVEYVVDNNDLETINLLNSIWNSYGKFDGLTLSRWTHVNSDLNPWRISREQAGNTFCVPTQNDSIRTYFDSLRQSGRLY